MGRPKTCPVCQSRKWRKEPSSGLITCSEGHVLQNYINETNEATELGPHSRRTRTLKSQRIKKTRTSKANPKLYHGPRGRWIYFQALQLILRHQILELTRLWGLVPEFEVVVRDIWALHLSLLPDPPPSEAWFEAQTQENPDLATGSQQLDEEIIRLAEGEDEDSPKGSGNEDSSSSSESESDGHDSLLSALQEEFGTDSDGAGESSKPKPNNVHSRVRRNKYEVPASNIAVLVLACWTMRIPVIYMDFIRLIESFALPYLEPTHLFPEDFQSHLNKYVLQALCPRHPPTVSVLHTLTSRLAKSLHIHYEIQTPEVNASPILWRAVTALCGPPTVYALSKSLAATLSIPLSLHPSLSPKLRRNGSKDPKTHQMDILPVEVALISVVVVVLKLVYGMDRRERQPTDPDDPACSLPAAKEYFEALRNQREKQLRSKEELFSASSKLTVLDLSEEDLDTYLDFCEKIFAPRRDAQATLPQAPSSSDPLKHPTIPITNPTAPLPAKSHTIFKSHDITGSLPPEYELVLELASRWTGVGTEDIGSVVESYERRLDGWWKRKKREMKAGHGKGKSSGGDEDFDLVGVGMAGE